MLIESWNMGQLAGRCQGQTERGATQQRLCQDEKRNVWFMLGTHMPRKNLSKRSTRRAM